MTRTRSLVRLAVAISLLSGLSTMFSGERADAAGSTVPAYQRITIQPYTQRQKIDTWGLDLKNPHEVRKFLSPTYAKRVTLDRRINTVRISLRADIQAVDSAGHLIPSYYTDTIQAVRNARLGNPAIRVLASRRTITDCAAYSDTRCLDFAPSLKGVDGQVSTVKYGRLVAEYLKYMRSVGLRVSFLSLDNEPPNNEGHLDPARFSAVVGVVRRNYPYTLPAILGNDNITADSAWLSRAPGSVTIASSHSNSRWYPEQSDDLRRFASVAKQRGNRLWNTEMHWDDRSPSRSYINAAETLLAFFDHTDAGYSGFFWWSWFQDGDKGLLWRSYVRSTAGARPVAVTDRDGVSTGRGTLTTRAFRNGDTVYLWVVNDTSKTVWNQRLFGTSSWRPSMDVWKQTGDKLTHSRVASQRMNGHVAFSYRSHTISLVTLRVA